jgi:hypothetical protein
MVGHTIIAKINYEVASEMSTLQAHLDMGQEVVIDRA